MGNLPHLLMTALLLLAAFLIGATLGLLARMAWARLTRRAPAIELPVLEPQPVGKPLVRTPVVSPMSTPRQPRAPLDVPEPDFSAALDHLLADATAAAEAASTPAADVVAEASEAADIDSVAALAPGPVAAPDVPDLVTEAATATLEPEMVALEEPVAPAPVAAVEPTRSRPEAALAAVPTASPPAPTAVPVMAPARVAGQVTSSVGIPPVQQSPAAEPTPLPQPSISAEVIAFPTPPRPAAAPPIEDAAVPPTEAPPVPPPSTWDIAPAEPDELAAMRAIEGDWTPAPVRRAEPDNPATAAVAQSAAAVAAARQAAEAALGDLAAPVTMRPVALERPRPGGRDDLTRIIGVVPVLDVALASLGIFHFDQIAGLTAENVAWIEAHLAIPGRMTREQWREQARELAAATAQTAAV